MEQSTKMMKTVREVIADWLEKHPTKKDGYGKVVPSEEMDFFRSYKRVTICDEYYHTRVSLDCCILTNGDIYKIKKLILGFLKDFPCEETYFGAEPEKPAATYLDIYKASDDDSRHSSVPLYSIHAFYAIMNYYNTVSCAQSAFDDAIAVVTNRRDWQKNIDEAVNKKMAEIKAQKRRETLHAKGMLDEDEIAEIINEALDNTIEYEGSICGGTNPENEWEEDVTFSSDLDGVNVSLDEETGCFSVDVSYTTPKYQYQCASDEYEDAEDENVSFGGSWEEGVFEKGKDPHEVVKAYADKIRADIDEQVKKA